MKGMAMTARAASLTSPIARLMRLRRKIRRKSQSPAKAKKKMAKPEG